MWAASIGLTPSKDILPYIQLGMVKMAGLPFLGWAAKAHSHIQRVAPQVAPPRERDGLPLWHPVYFRNEYKCSYYNMKKIRRGVLAWGQFQSLDDARRMSALPQTWKGVMVDDKEEQEEEYTIETTAQHPVYTDSNRCTGSRQSPARWPLNWAAKETKSYSTTKAW